MKYYTEKQIIKIKAIYRTNISYLLMTRFTFSICNVRKSSAAIILRVSLPWLEYRVPGVKEVTHKRTIQNQNKDRTTSNTVKKPQEWIKTCFDFLTKLIKYEAYLE